MKATNSDSLLLRIHPENPPPGSGWVRPAVKPTQRTRSSEFAPSPLKIDPANPHLAAIDGRTVIRRTRRCQSCAEAISVVEEVKHVDVGEGQGKYDAPNLATFPGPPVKCFRCRFDDLITGERWASGGSTHETIRQALAETAGATRPDEIKHKQELEARLAALGDDAEFQFPLGTVRIGWNTLQSGVGYAQSKRFLDRHVRGDHGSFGGQPAELGDLERFWPQLAGVAVENALAIESRCGFVRSAFEPFAHVNPTQQREVTSQIRVLTFINGDESQTLVTAEGRSSVQL